MSNDEYQHLDFWKMNTKEEAINILIKDAQAQLISDGYHTFAELYEHRHSLFIALTKYIKTENVHSVWRSIKHSDGSMFKGWFILGINKAPGQQLTYHLPIDLWESTNYAETLDKAPEYDGHTSQDVVKRINNLLK